MYPRDAIDFENPYVSPYLRRRCRSLEEVLSGCAAAWIDTRKPADDDIASVAAGSLTGTVGNEQQSGNAKAKQPGPHIHQALSQPEGVDAP